MQYLLIAFFKKNYLERYIANCKEYVYSGEELKKKYKEALT